MYVSTQRQTNVEEAKHHDDGKTQLQWILSMRGLDDVADVGDYGAKKYGQSNWRGGSAYMRYLGSCVRHVALVIRGQWLDTESNLPHLAHVVYNCLILLEWYKTGVGTDDRPTMAISKADTVKSDLPY